MYQIKILSLNGTVIDKRHFMRKPEESQIQAFWVESLKKHGVFIMLQNEAVRYIDLGQVA